MTTEEKQEMDRLCTAIQQEQNPARFTMLVEELNNLLEDRERKLNQSVSPDQGWTRAS